jgi:hypothetical protein
LTLPFYKLYIDLIKNQLVLNLIQNKFLIFYNNINNPLYFHIF